MGPLFGVGLSFITGCRFVFLFKDNQPGWIPQDRQLIIFAENISKPEVMAGRRKFPHTYVIVFLHHPFFRSISDLGGSGEVFSAKQW